MPDPCREPTSRTAAAPGHLDQHVPRQMAGPAAVHDGPDGKSQWPGAPVLYHSAKTLPRVIASADTHAQEKRGTHPTKTGNRPSRPPGDAVGLPRGQHHHHLAIFQARHLLDLGGRVHFRADAFQHAHADVLVRHLTAKEP